MKSTDNNQLLTTTIDDMKFTEKKSKKVKKILWIQIIVVSLYWGKVTTPQQKYNT